MGYRILVSDSKVINLDAGHDAFNGVDVDIETVNARTPSALCDVMSGVDALVVDAGTPVTAEVFEAGDSLAVVGRSGIGVDNVDIAAAAERGIPVVNVPDYCLDEVSTHALGLILACVRKLPAFDASVRRGDWEWTAGAPIHRLRGQTVGLVAFGQIARRLAAKLDSFGVDIVAFDPYVASEEMDAAGVQKVRFERLLDQSDILSVHAPLTDETAELFDDDAFSSMSEKTAFVNTARGGIVVEDALVAALESGTVAAAGLDVREEEPPAESPFTAMENVILTPHAAWYSEEARAALNQTVAADVVRVLEGERPRNPMEADSAGW